MNLRIWMFFLCFASSVAIQAQVVDSLKIDTLSVHQRIDSLLRFAEKYRGRPYAFGSTGPNNFDCSGFVQFVYGHFDVALPHGSGTQAGICNAIDLEDALPGDLIFFNGRKRNGQIGHVAMVHHWENDQLYIIHATVQAGVLLENMHASAYFMPRLVKVGRIKRSVLRGW
jgi:hypothetical protein